MAQARFFIIGIAGGAAVWGDDGGNGAHGVALVMGGAVQGVDDGAELAVGAPFKVGGVAFGVDDGGQVALVGVLVAGAVVQGIYFFNEAAVGVKALLPDPAVGVLDLDGPVVGVIDDFNLLAF